VKEERIVMKARPIIFSAPMVRAILEGRKTQTRRIIKPQPLVKDGKFSWSGHAPNSKFGAFWSSTVDRESIDIFVAPSCQYGERGDRLWVRETFQGPLINEDEGMPEGTYSPKYCVYRADGDSAPEFRDCDDNLKNCWKPSIYMPRWASRITLEIISVRVERLNDISASDAMKEGSSSSDWMEIESDCENGISVVDIFQDLWNSINGADSWNLNPWVWVIEFEVIERNIDKVINSTKEPS